MGALKRGYLGIAGQPVDVPGHQRRAAPANSALLVVGVTADSPAAAAGVLVGDMLLAFDGQPSRRRKICSICWSAIASARPVLRVLRGGQVTDVPVTVGERPGQ